MGDRLVSKWIVEELTYLKALILEHPLLAIFVILVLIAMIGKWAYPIFTRDAPAATEFKTYGDSSPIIGHVENYHTSLTQQELVTEFELGVSFFNSGDYSKALPYFKKVFDSNSSFPNAAWYLGRSHYNLREHQSALDVWRLVPENEIHESLLMISGTSSLAVNQYEAASEFFEKAMNQYGYGAENYWVAYARLVLSRNKESSLDQFQAEIEDYFRRLDHYIEFDTHAKIPSDSKTGEVQLNIEISEKFANTSKVGDTVFSAKHPVNINIVRSIAQFTLYARLGFRLASVDEVKSLETLYTALEYRNVIGFPTVFYVPESDYFNMLQNVRNLTRSLRARSISFDTTKWIDRLSKIEQSPETIERSPASVALAREIRLELESFYN